MHFGFRHFAGLFAFGALLRLFAAALPWLVPEPLLLLLLLEPLLLPFARETLSLQLFQFGFILFVVAAQAALLQAHVAERLGFGDLRLGLEQQALGGRVRVRKERDAVRLRQGAEGGLEAGDRVQAPWRVGSGLHEGVFAVADRLPAGADALEVSLVLAGFLLVG